MKKVLLVLPDADLVARIGPMLERGGYSCRAVAMPDEFEAELRHSTPDLVVMNEQLFPEEIQAWARVMVALSPDTRIIDLSDATPAARRLDVVVHGYVKKPFDEATFLAEVKRVLEAPPVTLGEPANAGDNPNL